MDSWLGALIWANVQAALWAVVLAVPALALAAALRGRLPVWRKGLWLAVLALPPVLVGCALLMPLGHSWLLPTAWFGGGAGGEGAAVGVPGVPTLGHAAGWILVGWLACAAALELGSALHLWRLLRHAQPVRDRRLLALYHELARGLGCARPPRLLAAAGLYTPFVVARPWHGLAIVLPEELLAEDQATALRAVLAHELAHARAGDPWVSRLVAPLRCLLPLAWLSALGPARCFWEEAAEETSDLRALRSSGLSGHTYGNILKDAVLGRPSARAEGALAFYSEGPEFSPAAHGLGATLARRLTALRLAPRWSEGLAGGAGALARALVVGGLVLLLARQSVLAGLMHDPRLAWAATPADGHHDSDLTQFSLNHLLAYPQYFAANPAPAGRWVGPFTPRAGAAPRGLHLPPLELAAGAISWNQPFTALPPSFWRPDLGAALAGNLRPGREHLEPWRERVPDATARFDRAHRRHSERPARPSEPEATGQAS